MKSTLPYLLILSCILVLSCKKERQPLKWNSDWSAPLANGSLSLQDLLGDSLLSSNADSSLVLKYEAELYKFDLSEITDIGDTTFLDTFALPFFSPVTFTTGQQFINQPKQSDLQIPGVELSTITIKDGLITYTLQSSIQGDVVYTYEIPSAVDAQGNVFTKDVLVPAASAGNHSIVTGSFSLVDYTLDLTGSTGTEVNKILTNINCKVASSTASVTVSNADTLYATNSISDLKIKSAEGYFGSHNFTANETSPLDLFSSLVSGGFDINTINVNFVIENGIGADASVQTNLISVSSGNNVFPLTHSVLGTNNNINRAYKAGGNINPSLFSVNLDENNSNIIDLIESIPDSISYDMDVVINPLGNIAGYGDFIDEDHPLRILLDASMPLNTIVNNLTLIDTLSIDLADSSVLNTASLELEIENGFPLNAQVDIAILDQNNMVAGHLLVPGDVLSGTINSQNKVESPHTSVHFIDLSARDIELLRSYGKLKLSLVFDSPDGYTQMPIYDYYRLNYSLKATANVALQTEY